VRSLSPGHCRGKRISREGLLSTRTSSPVLQRGRRGSDQGSGYKSSRKEEPPFHREKEPGCGVLQAGKREKNPNEEMAVSTSLKEGGKDEGEGGGRNFPGEGGNTEFIIGKKGGKGDLRNRFTRS